MILCLNLWNVDIITTSTVRRQLRKKRATARRLIWLHKKGYIVLQSAKITSLLRTLDQHHSAGPNFNKNFLLRFTKGTMAPKSSKQQKGPSWKCVPCRKINSGLDEWCPKCWQHWSLTADPSFVDPHHRPEGHPKTGSEQQSTWQYPETPAWQGDQWWPKKDRKSSRSASRRAKAKQKKEEDAARTAPSTPFATSSASPFAGLGGLYAAKNLPQPWPQKDTTSKETSSASTQPPLNADMVEAIRLSYPDPKDIPPRLKEMMAKYDLATRKSVAKDMERSWSSLEQMQERLKDLRLAKQNHRVAWLKSLQETMSTWEGHVKSYGAQQEEFARLISEATTEMETTRLSLDSLSKQAGEGFQEEVAPDPAEEQAAEEEEKMMRKKVVSVLQTCTAMAGVATQVDSSSGDEDKEKDKAKEEDGPRKRGRGQDAHAS